MFQTNFSKRSLSLKNILSYREDFETLGIKKGCSKEEIKLTYVKLAKKHHPDANKGKNCDNKFQGITEAYKRLLKEAEAGKCSYHVTMSSDNRNINHPGWYGWDSRSSYFSKTRVFFRKLNIFLRCLLLSIFSSQIFFRIWNQINLKK